ncbi:hypothetical protein [Rariglobus hedericola]|uniref:Uncharacterized protein n=1 Tax=Rariglobus hedericola TaxID=2597822 RepID=A0A556QK63_9BACT|nr:hypothetical protein [Rariglobus hedericola]TSJ77002.1 hypothetical protein FPL22_12900 [Rariglobus hedericola]
MNPNESQMVRDNLAQIENTNVAGLVGESWPNQDMSVIDVGGMNAAHMVAVLKRIGVCFGNALDEDAQLLPRFFPNNQNFRQPLDVINELQVLLSNIQARAWGEVATRCTWIAQYLMLCGYWSKTTKRAHAVYEKKASELVSSAELKVEEMETSLKVLRAEKDDLLKRIKEANSALGEITSELQAARGEKQQIADLLTSASNDQGKLSSILATQSNYLQVAEKHINQNQASQQQLDLALKDADAFYKTAKTDSEWVSAKRKEIEELTGKAADGSLGGTFRARKDELELSVKTWRSIAFLSAVMAAIYVPVAFIFIPSPHTSDGLILLANIGKIIPVAVYLGFVLKQYSRERSFLEEYAFKTSVAFVVNAYADQLASVRFQKTLEEFGGDQAAWGLYLDKREMDRKKLIKETVDRLFTPPQVHEEKAPSLVAFRPKAAVDILREAKELLSEAKK